MLIIKKVYKNVKISHGQLKVVSICPNLIIRLQLQNWQAAGYVVIIIMVFPHGKNMMISQILFRKNLKYFGYDEYLINKVSIHDLNKHYDVAIMDIPYNLYTPITYEEQCKLIQSARKICDKMIIVTYEDMSQEINQAGFLIIDGCIRKKTEYVKFGRYIYVCI